MKKVLLKVGGMSCASCSSGLEKYLNKQAGIYSATVNLIMNHASVEYDETKLQISDIESMIAKAGFESLGIDQYLIEEKHKTNEKYHLFVLTVLSIFIFYLSMGTMLGFPIFSIFDMHQKPFFYALIQFILTTFILLLERDILQNGYKNFIHKTPNMDTLVMLGVFSSYFYSIFGTIMIARGNTVYVEHLYFESAAIVLFFIKVGKYIESRNKDKTKEAIRDLMLITPSKATLLRENQEILVTIDEIKQGDIVICKPGEKIAVDGEVIEGVTHIDEAFITGESVPVKKEIGAKVIAGSINFDGMIQYRAERIGKDSTVSEIVRLVIDATNTKAPIAKLVDRISNYFVPTVIFLACISFLIWMMISRDFAFSINVFVTVLVVACPCSLGLATPLAIVIASGMASKQGILIKTSEALENAHKIKTIVFDKTGTLTKGKLSVAAIHCYHDWTEEKILTLAASMEQNSEHPIAFAITNYVRELQLDFVSVQNFQAIPGYGISASYQDDVYLIGNEKLMRQHHVHLNSNDGEKLSQKGNSILYIAKGTTLIALIGVRDVLNDYAKETIQKLQYQKIDVVMLTGDNEKTANYIAKELGITKVIANVLPKEKAEKIKEIKKQGYVMMVGDGINDSVSLVLADIGVSISSGTDIAMNSSNVVIMQNNLTKILDLISLSHRTIRNIKQNLFWAFFYNLCMIPIAIGLLQPFGIVMNPMFAAFAMTCSSLTVVFNALRLKKLK